MRHIFPRFQLVLCALILCVASSWAVPAYRGWQQRTLADGTTITVRQIGDEFYHYWETQDGQIALEQPDGTFVISDEGRPSGDQVLSRRKMSQMFPSKPRKAIGALNFAPRGLVILVQFSDVSFSASNDKQAHDDMLNKTGYNYKGATGSAVDYFKAQSNNTYAPVFDVIGPVTLSNNLAYYGAQGTIGGYSQNDMYIADFVIDAVTAAESAGCDFSKYDGDNDGYVDIVYFIYAGKGQADGGGTNTIWPHNWELKSALYYGTTHGGSGYSYSNLPRFDTKRINNYACSGELNGSGARSGIGTLCHEFSHVLGLPDYYVTNDDATNEGKNYTPGAWTIMDYGSYNNDGKTPPNYSVYDKYFFGWATPTILKKDETKNVVLTTTYGDAYQITGGSTLKSATATDRIWYLENRQKTGWDAYLPGHGLCVWEVTYNSDDWTNNEPNNENVGYTLVTANSQTRPYKPYTYTATTSSTSGTPFPGTSNVRSYTPATGCALTEITESSGNITFKYNTNWSYTLIGEHCSYPDDGMVLKNAPLNLTITPASGYTLADASCWEVTMGGNELTYGTGFTYNTSTGAFSISSVTGHVEIIIEGKRTVTWNVAGVTSTSFFSDGAALVLPSTPADCSGDNGKKFVGWTANSTVNGSAPSDLFTEAGSKTVTGNVTYYAVYATATSNSAPRRAKKASATYNKVTATSDITDGQYLIVYENGNVAFDGSRSTLDAASNTIAITISSSAITGDYEANEFSIDASKGTIKSASGYYIGQTSNNNGMNTSTSTAYTNTLSISDGNFSVLSSGGAYLRYNSNSDQARFRYFKSSSYTSQKAIQLYKKAGSGGGGDSGDDGDYTDYSTSCGTPCSQTPVMSFASATVAKTTADASFTQAVTITGKGSGQTVAYSSSDVTVATVDNSGAVTLKGKIGSTTITASVAANGDYCSASASYTLNVNAAPISVTLYYNNHTATFNNQTPPYTLPTTGDYVADMCDGDWTFAGWYGSAYTKSTTAPEYITQLTATGSAYAVYTTTETVSSAPARAKAAESGAVTITTSTTNIPTGYGDANKFTEYTFEGYKFKVQQMYLNSGKLQWRASGHASGTGTMYNTQTFPGKITSIVLTYNSSDANKNFTVKVGSSENPTSGTSITPTTNELVYTFDCSSANADYFVLANGSGAGYLDQIVINYAGSGGGDTPTTIITYYATTPECVTPCSNTPEMSFTDATVNKTTADATYTQAVTISGKGDGQTVAYSSSDATVATVDNSGVVTLKGKVGSTTITAAVEADGDYCAASASYTLNVNAAPIDVTLYYSGTSETLSNQTNPYTLPTTGDYVAAMCDGDWTFAGWYGSEYTKSTTAPTYITQLSATGSAYAVYTTTETVSSAPARAKADDSGTKTFKFADIASANSWTNSEAYTTVTDAPVTITAEGGGNNGKWYTSGGGSWRMYSGGTVNITVEGGAVTSVTSTPACSFTISDGVATFSPSARTDFTQIVVDYTLSGGGGGTTTTTYYATTPDCAVTCNLTSISLNTTSAKKTFFVGEQFTHDNVVVTANYSNCDSKTVNGFYTVPDMSSAGTKTVNISYTENGVMKEASYEINVVCELTSITLNTASATTTFDVGDTFTSEGVVVTAHYNSCDNKTVNGFYTVPDMSSAGTKTVNVSYTENGVTKETSYDITVVQPVYYTVTWIACGDTIQTETYREGAHLVFPTSPGANAGKAFYGWTTTQHYTGTSAPPIISEGGEVHANATYYAVYK